MPVYSMGIVLFLFLAGLVNLLPAGVVIVLLASVGLYVATPIVMKKKGYNAKDGVFHFVTTGSVLFIGLCVFFIYTNYGRLAMWDDEFSHWMDIVKIMTRIDHFGTQKGSGSVFPSYPPAMALFQYFLQKIQFIFGENQFSEWKAYFAYQLLSAIALLPFVSVEKQGILNRVQSVITYLGCLIVPLFLFERAYTSIYIDPFLGVLSAAGIAAVVLWREKDWLYIAYESVLCGTLVLSKDVGMYLMIFVVLIFMVEYYTKDGKAIFPEKKVARLLLGMAPFATAMAAKMLWKLELSISDTFVKFSAPIDFAGVRAVLNGTDQTYYTAVYENFLAAITYRYIYYERAGFNYVTIITFVAIALLCLLSKLKRQGTVESYRTVTLVGVASTFAIAAYAWSLFPLYISRFSEQEAVEVASFDRYISIVLLMGLLLAWLLGRKVLENISDRTKWGLVLSVLIVFSFYHAKKLQVNDLLEHNSVKDSISSRARFSMAADGILATCEENSVIKVLTQSSDSLVAANLQFMVKPYNVDDYCVTGLEFTPKELMAELIYQTDYIVAYNLDEAFLENYSVLFDDSAEIGNNHIYKFDETKNKLVQVF